MAPSKVTASILLSALAATVQGHGHVATIVADGVEYPGAVPANTPADSPGWTASNLDNGFVEPNSFSSPDIICHKEAKAPNAYAKVAAGGSVTLQWDTWPESHKGPVIDYLAACNGECSSADKTSLSFVKIAEKGLISGSNPGTWAADELISNGNSWTVEIPSSIAPGKYVLRHEILALHASGQPNGAQAYPQCVNLEITGSGSTTPSGEPATSFYTASDPGILFNLYESFSSYDIPGPALFSG
jgi:cellulase